MKITIKFLAFVGMFVALAYQNTANAAMVNCPEGCFCLNNGKYDKHASDFAEILHIYCNEKGQVIQSCFGGGWIINGVDIDCNHTPGANYWFDQFSELYQGFLGYYGAINGQVVYIPVNPSYQSVYSCPAAYPQSDPGAKTIFECYAYGQHGTKVYYSISASTGGNSGGSGTGGSMSGGQGGTTSTVTCAEGTYLPANSSTCVACSASMHHICPGGTFSTRNNTKIQGLKVECFPGEYLPSGATQCSPCKSEHLCIGGIYNVGGTGDVGSVMNAGYIFNGNHNVERCNPGYYMPGDSQSCVACTGNYACPGGLFYTDGGPYQLSRGRIACAYGHANSAHTECVSTSTLPSSMGQQPIQVEVNVSPQQLEMSSQPAQSPVVSGQHSQTVTKGKQRLSTGNRWQAAQSGGAKQQIVSTTVPETQQTKTEPLDDKLETAKKLISSGVAIHVN